MRNFLRIKQQTFFLAITGFLLITSAFTVVQAQPVAPTGSLFLRAEGQFVQGQTVFPSPYTRVLSVSVAGLSCHYDYSDAFLVCTETPGTTSVSVSNEVADVFLGRYQAKGTADYGSNGAMGRSEIFMLDQQGFVVNASTVSRWTDGFVITGGSGTGTASVSVLLEGALLESDHIGVPGFLVGFPDLVVERAAVLFSLDQLVEVVDEGGGISTQVSNLIFFADGICGAVNPTLLNPCPAGGRNLSEVLTGSFTFQYDQPFFLRGELTISANIAHAQVFAAADFLNTAKVTFITLPEGATLLAGSGSYAVCVDRDGDGAGGSGDPSCLASSLTDCNDADPSVYPGAPQICGDGLNNDCSHPAWPALTGTNETDDDGDTFSECQGDCNDGDNQVWDAPGEVRDLVILLDAQTLAWTSPLNPGGVSVLYDTLRSASAADFVSSATCVETNDGLDAKATDPIAPPPGGAFYYLVRAENACPAGIGPLGADSAGTPRAGRSCP